MRQPALVGLRRQAALRPRASVLIPPRTPRPGPGYSSGVRPVVLLLACAALARADDGEQRFLAAWFAAEDPATVDEAERALRDLLAQPDAPPLLVGRSLLGLARCAATRGDRAEEGRLLDEALRRHGEHREIRRRVLRWRGEERWVRGIRSLSDREFLDLDTGGVYASATPDGGARAEMAGDRLLAAAVADAAFAALAPEVSARPWQRVATDAGNTSWVQLLQRRSGTVVHFLTRVGGAGTGPLPALRGLFAVGRGRSIEVVFGADPHFAHYRIERRTGDEGPFVPLGIVAAPSYLDREVDEAAFYTYRLQGIEAGGRGGIPVEIAAGSGVRGVISGTVELAEAADRRFDFRRRAFVEEGGDLDLGRGPRDGRGALLFDGFGHLLHPLDPARGDARSAWDQARPLFPLIRVGDLFLVPLRCGGVARCRLATAPQGTDLRLEYEFTLDGTSFPPVPRLSAEVRPEGVLVSVATSEPWFVREIEAQELLGEPEQRAKWRIPVEGGVALDARPGKGSLRAYSAFGVDDRMRRTGVGTCHVALGPFEARRGEVTLRDGDCFSVECNAITAAETADLVVDARDGGREWFEIEAPRGILNLDSMITPDEGEIAALDLFETVVGLDPAEIAFAERARGDARAGSSQLFLLRTQAGGWAKVAAIARPSRREVTLRYVYHPVDPLFGGDAAGSEARGGVLFRGLGRLIRRNRVLDEWRDGLRAMRAAPIVKPGPALGEMPDAAKRQEVLFARKRHGDPMRATFSFAHGRRDDPALRLTSNDWDLQFNGDEFVVRLSEDDASTITDLGARDWQGVGAILEGSGDRAPVAHGRLYLVHAVDADTNFFALFRVTALMPEDRVAFEWVGCDSLGLQTSPGLELTEAARLMLRETLAGLPATPEAWLAQWQGAERETRERLRAQRYRIGVTAEPAAAFLDAFSLVTGIPVTAAADLAGIRVTLGGQDLTAECILRRTGLRWTVRPDGTLAILAP